MSGREEPREPVEGCGEVVAAIIRRRLPGVQGHAHPKRAELTPVLGKQRPLGSQCRRNGGGRGGKGSLHRIADRLEVDAAMRLDGRMRAEPCALRRPPPSLRGPAPRARCCPSMSVKRKVTVPWGNSDMTYFRMSVS